MEERVKQKFKDPVGVSFIIIIIEPFILVTLYFILITLI